MIAVLGTSSGRALGVSRSESIYREPPAPKPVPLPDPGYAAAHGKVTDWWTRGLIDFAAARAADRELRRRELAGLPVPGVRVAGGAVAVTG